MASHLASLTTVPARSPPTFFSGLAHTDTRLRLVAFLSGLADTDASSSPTAFSSGFADNDAALGPAAQPSGFADAVAALRPSAQPSGFADADTRSTPAAFPSGLVDFTASLQRPSSIQADLATGFQILSPNAAYLAPFPTPSSSRAHSQLAIR